RARRKALSGGGDVPQLPDLGVVPPKRRLQFGESTRQDLGIRAGAHGQDSIAVTDQEGTLLVLELEALALEDPAIVVLEDREEDSIPQLGLEGLPVDVE